MEKWLKNRIETLDLLIRDRNDICADNDDKVVLEKYGFDKSVWIQSEKERNLALARFLDRLIKDYYKDKKWKE